MTDANIDWSASDKYPPNEIDCFCGASYVSHSKVKLYEGKMQIITRQKCPGCQQCVGNARASRDTVGELMTVSTKDTGSAEKALGYVNGYKRLSRFLRASQHGKRVQFWCPGCDDSHDVLVVGPDAWLWDGDVETPTFSPSIKREFLRTKNDENGRWNGDWVKVNGKPVEMICHTYVEKGIIRFLEDSTHEMAGKTAPISEWYTHETDGLPGRPPLK